MWVCMAPPPITTPTHCQRRLTGTLRETNTPAWHRLKVFTLMRLVANPLATVAAPLVRLDPLVGLAPRQAGNRLHKRQGVRRQVIRRGRRGAGSWAHHAGTWFLINWWPTVDHEVKENHTL